MGLKRGARPDAGRDSASPAPSSDFNESSSTTLHATNLTELDHDDSLTLAAPVSRIAIQYYGGIPGRTFATAPVVPSRGSQCFSALSLGPAGPWHGLHLTEAPRRLRRAHWVLGHGTGAMRAVMVADSWNIHLLWR